MNDPSIPISNKTMSRKLFFAYVLLIALLFTVLTGSLTATVIRSIDDLLARLAADTAGLSYFVIVFSALDTAELEVHGLIPGILAFLFTLGVGLLLRTGWKNGGARFVYSIVLAVPVGLILFAVSLAVSVLLTEVNDIRFGSVLLSLYKNLDVLSALM